MRRGVICVLLLVMPAVSFAAEPLTLLLMHILRQQIASSIEKAIEEAERERKRNAIAVIPRAQYDLDDREIRALIDEGFVHLTAAQRAEVFAGVKRILTDPNNAAARPFIVQELAVKASAVRQAHERLSSLSPPEKKAIAVQAREEYVRLPAEEREQMLQVLQSGAAPLPRDLNDMIMAEFRTVPAAVVLPGTPE